MYSWLFIRKCSMSLKTRQEILSTLGAHFWESRSDCSLPIPLHTEGEGHEAKNIYPLRGYMPPSYTRFLLLVIRSCPLLQCPSVSSQGLAGFFSRSVLPSWTVLLGSHRAALYWGYGKSLHVQAEMSTEMCKTPFRGPEMGEKRGA